MTKEQAQSEFLKLLNKKIDDEYKIIEDAKEKGTWQLGFDSNRNLFKDTNRDFVEKVKLLKSMIDE